MRDYFTGTQWARKTAKKALPVLINFAESERTTTYSDLAKEILGDEKYRRPLMSALGRLGKGLELLNEGESKRLGRIPPIQLLVCNQRTGRPGNRALNFLGFKKSDTDKMSEQQLDSLVLAANQEIFAYKGWHDVLKTLDLQPVTLNLPAMRDILPEIKEIERQGGPEGNDHKRLKFFLARNPTRIGLRCKRVGDTEFLLLSGDRLDISFREDPQWIAVEVKPEHSPLADLIRGIFQCIKYRAVLAAQTRYEVLAGGSHLGPGMPRVIFAYGGVLSDELQALADTLDVEVRCNISVPNDFVT